MSPRSFPTLIVVEGNHADQQSSTRCQTHDDRNRLFVLTYDRSQHPIQSLIHRPKSSVHNPKDNASYPNRTSDLVITSDTPYHWAKEASKQLFSDAVVGWLAMWLNLVGGVALGGHQGTLEDRGRIRGLERPVA